MVQGDTTTAMAAALSAFYRKIPVDHVEAGLRRGDIYSPWPEEVNRKVIGSIAALHFAPTARAADALIRENVPSQRIHVTGNTVIDALLKIKERIGDSANAAPIDRRSTAPAAAKTGASSSSPPIGGRISTAACSASRRSMQDAGAARGRRHRVSRASQSERAGPDPVAARDHPRVQLMRPSTTSTSSTCCRAPTSC